MVSTIGVVKVDNIGVQVVICMIDSLEKLALIGLTIAHDVLLFRGTEIVLEGLSEKVGGVFVKRVLCGVSRVINRICERIASFSQKEF